MDKEQADDVHAAAVDDANQSQLVAITKSMLYFGGMPLSFAVTVGDLEICKKLMASAPEDEVEVILNRTDLYGGNTALHMAALHGRRDIFDWLVEQGRAVGKNALSIMNKDGHTALTLAARMGNVELFRHILRQHFRTVTWTFGDVQLSQTSLEQVDTFKIQKPDSAAEPELRKENSISKWFARRFSRGHSFRHRRKQKKMQAVEKEVWELHRERKFRSALEVIVDHEIEAFCEEETFNRLVMEKWDKFGFRLYVLRTLVPYFVFLCFFTANVLSRCREIRIQWAQAMRDADFRSADTQHDVQGSTFLSGMVAAFGVVFFIDGWSNRRLRPQDLNPEQDGDVSMSKVMRAVYRNMSFGLSLSISAVVILAFGFQVTEQEYLELNMLAISCIFVFCYLLHTLVPFKMFGVLVIMIYRIFVKDVLYFLIIYAFLLCAFGVGTWMMFQKAQYPDELDYGQIRMDEYAGASLLSSVWVSLHEVDVADYIMASQYPGLSMALHLVWILMSTVLMLNLLIGLMRQTFDSDKTKSASHRLWIFPFASLVLRHERMLHTRWARLLLRFKHPARYRSGLMVNNHIDFIDDDHEIACQRFYQVSLDRIGPSSASATSAQATPPLPADSPPDPAPSPHSGKQTSDPPHEETRQIMHQSLPTPPAPHPQESPDVFSGAVSAGRQPLPPPPTAMDAALTSQPHATRRMPPALHIPQHGFMQGQHADEQEEEQDVGGEWGVVDATVRVRALQRRMEAIRLKMGGVQAVTQRQPALVRQVAARVRECGAAISHEMRPMTSEVRECERRLQAVEGECEAIAELVFELDAAEGEEGA